MQYVIGDEAAKGECSTRPSRFGMRRNCDACGRKKRRCDGEQPCSRCVRSKSQCRYSKRRWHLPEHLQHRQQGHHRQSDRDTLIAMKDLAHSTPGWPMERRMLSLKRCRLRASPATGLVGMQENVCLSDFFGCVGFLLLTNESQIREAMVKIMVLAAPQQEPAFSADCFGEERQAGTLLDWGTFDTLSEMDRLPKDPSCATFWSAVALGALAKGCSFQTAERYSQLAGEALAACHSGSTNAELAKASAILTYVTSLMGDMAKFHQYLELSEFYLRASIEQGSCGTQHAGLPDLLLHFRKVGNVQSGPMDSFWAQEEDPPQLNKVTTEGDLYRFVMQSFRVYDRAVYEKAQERCAGSLDHFYSGGPSHRVSSANDPLPGEVSKAMAAVSETASSIQFEPLADIADRPRIRAGIGDLLINGTLVFAKAAKGDLPATLEKLDRSVEVYERFPGFCRCMMVSHIAHMLLAMLAAIDDARARRMYERLRGTFNSCRASDTLPMPPLDEWQGMAAICSDFHCRVIENVIKSERMDAVITLPVDPTRESAGLRQTASNPHERTQSTMLPASVLHGEIVELDSTSPGCSRTGSNATSTCAGTKCPVGAPSCVGAALAPPASRSDPSIPLDTASDNASIVNGLFVKHLHTFPRSAAGVGQYDDDAKPKDDDISTADWLEVARAMSDSSYAA